MHSANDAWGNYIIYAFGRHGGHWRSGLDSRGAQKACRRGMLCRGVLCCVFWLKKLCAITRDFAFFDPMRSPFVYYLTCFAHFIYSPSRSAAVCVGKWRICSLILLWMHRLLRMRRTNNLWRIRLLKWAWRYQSSFASIHGSKLSEACCCSLWLSQQVTERDILYAFLHCILPLFVVNTGSSGTQQSPCKPAPLPRQWYPCGWHDAPCLQLCLHGYGNWTLLSPGRWVFLKLRILKLKCL